MTVIRALVIPILFVCFVLKSIVAYLALMNGILKVRVERSSLATWSWRLSMATIFSSRVMAARVS